MSIRVYLVERTLIIRNQTKLYIGLVNNNVSNRDWSNIW